MHWVFGHTILKYTIDTIHLIIYVRMYMLSRFFICLQQITTNITLQVNAPDGIDVTFVPGCPE